MVTPLVGNHWYYRKVGHFPLVVPITRPLMQSKNLPSWTWSKLYSLASWQLYLPMIGAVGIYQEKCNNFCCNIILLISQLAVKPENTLCLLAITVLWIAEWLHRSGSCHYWLSFSAQHNNQIIIVHSNIEKYYSFPPCSNISAIHYAPQTTVMTNIPIIERVTVRRHF